MMEPRKKVVYSEDFQEGGSYALGIDIGGTNSNFGLFSLDTETPVLTASLHYKSKEIKNFSLFFKTVLSQIKNYWGITVEHACIGAAGAVYPNRTEIKPTNVDLLINVNDIKKATKLRTVFLINDFEAVALGADMIDPKDLIVINPGVTYIHGNKGFIGAGTGLGKSMLVWQEGINRYLPVPSEGGHADAAMHHEIEFEFLRWVHNTYSICPVSWESVLAGDGLLRVYHFFSTKKKYPETEITREIASGDFNPDLISRYAVQDAQSADTFKFYVTLYARCAKSFALDTLALNGMFIAGGIAAKNIGMFRKPEFLEEFFLCGKHSPKVRKIGVRIIADYNVSLYGAIKALQLHQLERM